MENTANQEQESIKNEEITSEMPFPESPEQIQAEKQAGLGDPAKKLQDELAEAKDKYLRLYAEFDNHRRRTAKEKLEMIQSANEQLLQSLLPIIDDFERAEKSFKDKNDKEAEGFFLIQNKFKKIIEQKGVKQMEAAAGSDFNPDLHEAIRIYFEQHGIGFRVFSDRS